MAKKKRSIMRTPSGERSLLARILAIVAVLIIIVAMVFTMLPAYMFAAEGVITIGEEDLNPDGSLPLLVDDADLLTEAEEQELVAGLNSFRASDDFDIVVLTVNSLGGMDVVDYADNFFDDNGYGGGEDRDGAMILVSTENRDWTMSTSGYGNIAITDYGMDQIDEDVLGHLSSGNYLQAFETFADDCAYLVREAKAGNIIDVPVETPEEPAENSEVTPSGNQRRAYPWAANIGIAGVIGAVVSFISNSSKKSKLKSVKYKNQAADYIRKDSLVLNEKRDRYLYSQTKVVQIGNSSNNNQNPGNQGTMPPPGSTGQSYKPSGGTTVHQSQSGNFHGGGHAGKF